MQQKEVFNDWLFRYQFIHRSRFSEKSKQRFLKSLLTDLAQIRTDLKVIEYNRQKKSASRNIYVGNIEQADRVICTYYDTPPQHFGSYLFFDRKEQGRRTTLFILVCSVLMILFGIAGTLLYMRYAAAEFVLFSFQTLFLALLFGAYFMLLGQLTKGALNKKTLARNTSSVLALLEMINQIEDPHVAFAFVDEGSYGEEGLDVLASSTKKKATIFYLDSIGANAPLHALGKDFSRKRLEELNIDHQISSNKINYLFSAETTEKNAATVFYLDKKELNTNVLNRDNLSKAIALLN